MKPEKRKKAIAGWEKAKKWGIIKYTLIYGGAVALGFNIFTFDWDELYMFQNTTFLLNFIGKFVFISVFVGVITWWFTKKQYEKAIKYQETENSNTEN